MAVRIWEWVVDLGADHAPSGVSGARHQAMEALSRTLIAAGGPATGRVVPIVLVDGRSGFDYLRLNPALTANYEDYVIRWHRISETGK